MEAIKRNAAQNKLESLPWIDLAGSCPDCGSGFIFHAVDTATKHGKGLHCRDCDYKWVPEHASKRP